MILLRTLPLLVLMLTALSSPGWTFPLEIVPFQTANRSPVAQIFGLPGPGTALLLPPGGTAAEFAVETVQNFAKNTSGDEVSFFDGETYRFNLALRRGVTSRFEAGLEVPYLSHRGGFLDGFMRDFHDTFGLSQSGRNNHPRNRLLYSYTRGGVQEILVDEHAEGLGDVRLRGAWQLWRNEGGPSRGAALHASLKLPTGDSDNLFGSGSTDLALWVSGTRGWERKGSALALFGAAGVMGLTDGDVLPEQQRNLVGFGTLGGGWRPASWLVVKLQIDTHTPFFDSDLQELGVVMGQLLMGVDLALGERTALELGVSEDIVVDTAPDTVFRLALRSRF
jgi:hypothetical protein